MLTRFSPLTFVWAALFTGMGLASLQADEAHRMEYETSIKPMLQKYCYDCHGPEKAKADVNLAENEDYSKFAENSSFWQHNYERIFAFEMPPKGKSTFEFHERDQVLNWLRRLPKPQLDCSSIASDRNTSFYRGHVMSRRLTRAEYDNTIRDLFGVKLNAGRVLSADAAGGEGFDTTGDTLFTSPLAIEKYLEAAEMVTRAFLADDEANLSDEARVARAALITAWPSEQLSAREAAREVISRLLPRAWRRPVEAAEVEKILSLYDRRAARGEGFLAGLRLAVRGVLVSPHFLFLAEPETEESGVCELGPYPLIARLSYFLWGSMPDEELTALAASGEILRDEVLTAQVRRMLRDPRAAALGERFAAQWLELDKLGTEVKPDPQRFPEFDAELADAMRGEVVAMFNHLIRDNEPLEHLLDADYTYVNARLARHYGLPEVGDGEFHKVSLQGKERGGLLGMAAIHTLTSLPLRTSPVLRGRWVLDVLLGERVPPPPPDVPPLEEGPEQALSSVSLREQLELHRQNAECASCHDKMDPLGFGLEAFDVLGRLRSDAVDASGTLPNGDSFNGPAELKQVISKRRDQIMRRLMRRLVGYALGRELGAHDQCIINDALAALSRDGGRPQGALEVIALSKGFRWRYYPKSESTVETAAVQ